MQEACNQGSGSLDGDPEWWPVRGDHLPDQALAGDCPPGARVAGFATVVAHEEVLTLWYVPRLVAIGRVVHDIFFPPGRLDVGLFQLLAVDPDVAVFVLVNRVARQADQALD